MSTTNLPRGKRRPAHKADNLTAVCEPIVSKMWKPRHLTTLWVSTACYRDNLTLPVNYFQQVELLSRTTRFGICVPSSGLVFYKDRIMYLAYSCKASESIGVLRAINTAYSIICCNELICYPFVNILVIFMKLQILNILCEYVALNTVYLHTSAPHTQRKYSTSSTL
jgi:hypothetical protein